MTPFEELLDYRLAVADLYRRAREGGAGPAAHRAFREARDALFRDHPQSALPADRRSGFRGLEYYPYDPAWRLVVPLEPAASPATLEVELAEDGLVRLRRVASVRLEVGGSRAALAVYWVAGYGGGLFLPFRDATSGTETYGGGRYLLDTVKHADLGREDRGLVLDFNYAYSPSCAHDDRWDCPLAPPENRLPFPVRAGEKAPFGP